MIWRGLCFCDASRSKEGSRDDDDDDDDDYRKSVVTRILFFSKVSCWPVSIGAHLGHETPLLLKRIRSLVRGIKEKLINRKFSIQKWTQCSVYPVLLWSILTYPFAKVRGTAIQVRIKVCPYGRIALLVEMLQRYLVQFLQKESQ